MQAENNVKRRHGKAGKKDKNLLSGPSEEAWPVESLILDFYTVKE